MALRDKLLAGGRSRFQRTEVTDPEVRALAEGDPVFVRELTAAERDAFEASKVRVKFDARGKPQQTLDFANLRARLLVKVLVDAKGNRIFTDADAAVLGELPGRLLDPLFEMAQKLSGLSKEAEEKLVEEAEKNSSAPESGSPSG